MKSNSSRNPSAAASVFAWEVQIFRNRMAEAQHGVGVCGGQGRSPGAWPWCLAVSIWRFVFDGREHSSVTPPLWRTIWTNWFLCNHSMILICFWKQLNRLCNRSHWRGCVHGFRPSLSAGWNMRKWHQHGCISQNLDYKRKFQNFVKILIALTAAIKSNVLF